MVCSYFNLLGILDKRNTGAIQTNCQDVSGSQTSRRPLRFCFAEEAFLLNWLESRDIGLKDLCNKVLHTKAHVCKHKPKETHTHALGPWITSYFPFDAQIYTHTHTYMTPWLPPKMRCGMKRYKTEQTSLNKIMSTLYVWPLHRRLSIIPFYPVNNYSTYVFGLLSPGGGIQSNECSCSRSCGTSRLIETGFCKRKTELKTENWKTERQSKVQRSNPRGPNSGLVTYRSYMLCI